MLRQIEAVIDDELQKAQCHRLSLPLLQSDALWRKTGRWDTTGPEVCLDVCASPIPHMLSSRSTPLLPLPIAVAVPNCFPKSRAQLFRLKDRHHNDYCLAPTHEEEITSLVAAHQDSSATSLRLYQIGACVSVSVSVSVCVCACTCTNIAPTWQLTSQQCRPEIPGRNASPLGAPPLPRVRHERPVHLRCVARAGGCHV